MFVKKGLNRHSEVNLQCIITSCIKGGNQELQGRATKALRAKARRRKIGSIYRSAVMTLSVFGGLRIIG